MVFCSVKLDKGDFQSLNCSGGGLTRPIPTDEGADQHRGDPIVGQSLRDKTSGLGCKEVTDGDLIKYRVV